MRDVVEIWLADRAAADGDSLAHGIGHPVEATARVNGGGAIQMNADGAWIPGERIVVVIETVPAGIERRAITARGSGRRAEFFLAAVVQDRESHSAGELLGLIDIPVP